MTAQAHSRDLDTDNPVLLTYPMYDDPEVN